MYSWVLSKIQKQKENILVLANLWGGQTRLKMEIND